MPKRVGSFVIRRKLGEGGMGIVYLGWQPALERYVTLKKLRADLLRDRDAAERFRREARAAASVHHQNVVSVYDGFDADGERYIAFEHVPGEDLQRLLSRGGPFPPRAAALIAARAASALEAIHAAGIVHRDLKPANVLVSVRGEVKLADFGIAHRGGADRLTRPGTAIGSLPYMAPEQMQGEPGDHRSDLYALGALLYELLTGRLPFPVSEEQPHTTLLERIRRGRFASPRAIRPGTPRALCRIVRRCLRARPDKRPKSATQVRRRLERWLRRPDPAAGVREIAADLWSRGLVSETCEATMPRGAGGDAAPVRRSPFGWSRRLIPAAVVAGLALGVPLSALVWSWVTTEAPAALESKSRGAAAVHGQPSRISPIEGRLRLAAPAWTAVRIEGVGPVLTPRCEPLTLPAGEVEVELTWPGRPPTRHRVRVVPGQTKMVPSLPAGDQAAPVVRRSPRTEITW